MKRMTLLLVVAVAPFSAHGQNLVSNPGFGADTVGWSGKTLVHNAADGYIGLGSAEVSEGGLDPDPIISQCVDITAYPDGTRYVFGAWLKAVNYDPSTGNTQPFARLRYSSTQACGNLSGEDGGAQGWPTHVMGSWQRYSAAGQPPPGTASVQLQVGMFQAPDAPVSITRIDDAFLEVSTEPDGLIHLWPFNDNTQDLVGRDDGVAGGSLSYVAGVIDEVFVFNRALSPEELDEVRGFGVGILFSDGFESGGTLRWSTAAPWTSNAHGCGECATYMGSDTRHPS